jgi:hypothetical protein
MASKYNTEQFKADAILLNKIYRFAGYCKKDLPTLLKAVKHGDLAMESVVENAISKIGKLKRVDIVGMDFDDGSDAKKVTVCNQGTTKAPCRGAQFSTKNKKGILRVVVVDPITEEVFYFKIPPNFYIGSTQKRREVALRINFSNTGGPPNLDKARLKETCWDHRVKSFKQLCS